MPIQDRADSILARVLAEPALSNGAITFIAHSLGGLVVKAILRNADRDAKSDERADSLLHRLKGVAFLGTPHQGSDQASLYATLGKILVLRPAPALLSLVRNDAALRDLNTWYRSFVANAGYAHLVMREAQPTGLLGQIVKPDSADPGLSVPCIPIDANHIDLTKPSSKLDQFYILIKDFIESNELAFGRKASPHEDLAPMRSIEAMVQTGIGGLEQKSDLIQERIESLAKSVSASDLSQQKSATILDGVARERLTRLRKSRFYGGASATGGAIELSSAVLEGELAGTTPALKSELLGWCARFLAKEDLERANELIRCAARFGNSTEADIAVAMGIGFHSDLSEAIKELGTIDTPNARSAQLFLKDYEKGPHGVIEWAETAQFDAGDFDADGKFLLLLSHIRERRTTDALSIVDALSDTDFEAAPVLLRMAADACLLMAVPPDAHDVITRYYLADFRTLPLKGTKEALQLRRRAAEYYSDSAHAARDLGASEFANYDDDRCLWLQLRDPDVGESARLELRQSLAEDSVFLRRIPIAVDFGVDFDVARAERLADRQEARLGKVTVEVALARYYLALREPDLRAAAAKIEQHRDQICEVLQPEAVLSVLVEMLARAGARDKAQGYLDELKCLGVDSEQERILQQLIDGVFDELGPVAVFQERYRESGSLEDLSRLVSALKDDANWEGLARFGKELFDSTLDVRDAERYAEGLYNSTQVQELRGFLDQNSSLIDQSRSLLSISAWADFRAGDFSSARQKCDALLAASDDQDHRTLRVYISIYSGNWTDLSEFVEAEWKQRSERTAEELLRAAQLAQASESPRLREIVFEAAERGAKDPGVLIGCYQIAVESGLEDVEGPSEWINEAAALSGSDGPVQTKTLDQLLELQPSWERRRDQSLKQLERGESPYFVAAQTLNRSLIELILTTACTNRDSADLRHRSPIWAFSGSEVEAPDCNAEESELDFSILAIEPISLLLLQMTGALRKVLSASQRTVIAHSTLAWLFNERRRVRFHQPSRVATARKLKALVADGKIEVFSPTAAPDPGLTREVGRAFAEALVHARRSRSEFKNSVFAVHGARLLRVGASMEQEADIEGFADSLASCDAIVQFLRDRGAITQSTASKALSYLKSRGAPSSQNTIPQDSILILDSMAVSYLLHLGLLDQLSRAGLRCYVLEMAASEAEALVALDESCNEVESHIESLRSFLRTELESGRIITGVDGETDGTADENELSVQPSLSVINLAEQATALVIDDRYFNSHRFVETGAASVPIFSSLQILTELERLGQVSNSDADEWRTSLRRAAVMFVAPTTSEIVRYVSQATRETGEFFETAELRAVRESILKLRQSSGVRIPADLSWIVNTLAEVRSAIPALWAETSISTEVAASASTWLLELMDPRDWAHVWPGLVPEHLEGMYAQYISTLVLTASAERKGEYWEWFESVVINRLREREPRLFERLIDVFAELAFELTKAYEAAEASKNGR